MGTASVTLVPGLYYFQGGLSVSGAGASLTGGNVLLYFNPSLGSAGLTVASGAHVTLMAMASGPFQGIAIWQERSSGVPLSVNGGTLNVTGTVYAAMGQVSVSNGGVLQMQGNASLGIAAHLIALDMVVMNGTVLVDASANPFSQP
jgi:hypothetical protein